MEIVAFIFFWLLIVLLPTVLLFMIPLVGWILGIAWMIAGTAMGIKALRDEL